MLVVSGFTSFERRYKTPYCRVSLCDLSSDDTYYEWLLQDFLIFTKKPEVLKIKCD